LSKIGKYYLYILLLASPFLAYLIDVRLSLIPYFLIGTITSFFAIFFLFKRKLFLNKLIALFLLLFIYYFTWDFLNGRYEKFGLVKILFKSLTLHTVGFLIINENLNINKKTIAFFVKGIKLLIILSAVLSFIQLFYNPEFFNPFLKSINPGIKAYEIRNWSIWGFLDPNDVGISFLAYLAIVISYDLLNKNKYYYIWLLLGIFVSFATNGRYIMINMTLLIIFTYSQGYYKFKLIRLAIFTLIASSLLLYVFSKLTYTPVEYYEERILSTSAESRVFAVEVFTKNFLKSPWFGSGLRVTKDLQHDITGISSQIHIGYLSHLFEYGIVGSSLIFLIWILILKRFYLNARKSNFYGSLMAFTFFLIANITLVEYSLFHVGLLFAFVFDKYYRNNLNEDSSLFKTK
jgi:hypothetical protein